jgi:hypothetical protein
MAIRITLLTVLFLSFSLGLLADSEESCKVEKQKRDQAKQQMRRSPQSGAAAAKFKQAQKAYNDCREKMRIAKMNLGKKKGQHLDSQQKADKLRSDRGASVDQAGELSKPDPREPIRIDMNIKAKTIPGTKNGLQLDIDGTVSNPAGANGPSISGIDGTLKVDANPNGLANVDYEGVGYNMDSTGNTVVSAEGNIGIDVNSREALITSNGSINGNVNNVPFSVDHQSAMTPNGQIGTQGNFSTTGATGRFDVVADSHEAFNTQNFGAVKSQLGKQLKGGALDQLGLKGGARTYVTGNVCSGFIFCGSEPVRLSGMGNSGGLSVGGSATIPQGADTNNFKTLSKGFTGGKKAITQRAVSKRSKNGQKSKRAVARGVATDSVQSEAVADSGNILKRLQSVGLGSMIGPVTPTTKFKDNYIERTGRESLPSSSIRTIAFNGRNLPKFCPDFRKVQSATLLHNSGRQFLLLHRYFMGARFRLKPADVFMNHTGQGMNYFDQESLARVLFATDSSNFKLLNTGPEESNFQFASFMKKMNSMLEDEDLIRRQVDLLGRVRDGYDAAAVAAQMELDALDQSMADHSSSLVRGQAIMDLPGGNSMVQHILNSTKYLAGISMLQSADDQLDQARKLYMLNCDRYTQFMVSPESRQQIALIASDHLSVFITQLEHRLSAIQKQRVAVDAIASGWKDGNAGMSKVRHCFTGSSSSLVLDRECRCQQTKRCATISSMEMKDLKFSPLAPQGKLLPLTIYGPLADVNRHLQSVENSLYAGNLDPSMSKKYLAAIRKIKSAKGKILTQAGHKGHSIVGSEKQQKDQSLSPVKMSSKGRSSSSTAIGKMREDVQHSGSKQSGPLSKSKDSRHVGKKYKVDQSARQIASARTVRNIRQEISAAKDEYAKNHDIELFMQEVREGQEVYRDPEMDLFRVISGRYRIKMLAR